MKIHLLDLQFQQSSQTIGAFLIEGRSGVVLVETGPERTFPELMREVERIGFRLEDIKDVLLTHIHFDHAGAAWKLAELGARIFVHPFGAPHLESPERLWNSAAQIYGEENMGKLWGSMEPIPASSLVILDDCAEAEVGGETCRALYTSGHAIHHIAWEFEEGIFTGDVAGVCIEGGPVVPPCPPPDIHLENWKESLQLIRKKNPSTLFLTHYGKVTDVNRHLDELEEAMDIWAGWMKDAYDKGMTVDEATPLFMQFTRTEMEKRGVSEYLQQRYEYANPSWMSVAGLMRYWKLKSQGRI